MDVEDIFEIAFENLVYKNNGRVLEYINNCLDDCGYLATFYYGRDENDKSCVKFLVQDFNRDDNYFDRHFSSRKEKEDKKSKLLDFLRDEWNIGLNTSYEFMDELDGMLELSRLMSKVYERNCDFDSIEYLFIAVVRPMIDFVKNKIASLDSGISTFSDYEKIVNIFLNIYVISDSFKVINQVSDSTNQHRRDFQVRIRDTESRLFNKLVDETECKSIVVECKNSNKKEELRKAVNQINKYSYSSRFGKLGFIFIRSKGNPFKLTDYVNSPCTIIVFDDDDIISILNEIDFSFLNYRTNKDKKLLSKEISACFDIYDRYQELCEKSH
ncbi:hypothetical protein [Vibrio rotiferianus]|uniref:hypothetical protein n=1 Tax=Vibrio rotiferianus TaxID=190895 RepID=UPI00390AB0AA